MNENIKEIRNEAIKDRITRDIRNLFELEIKEKIVTNQYKGW